MYFTFEVLDIFVDSVDVVGDCLVNDLQGGVHPHHRGQHGRRDQGQQGEAQHSQSWGEGWGECEENNQCYLETNTAISGCQSQIWDW